MWFHQQRRGNIGYSTPCRSKCSTIQPSCSRHETVRISLVSYFLSGLTNHRSGQSIFSRPRPIDINAARRAGYTNLDIDIESDDEDDTELARPLVRNPVVFDADQPTRQQREPLSEMPLAAHSLETRDAEDMWAELG